MFDKKIVSSDKFIDLPHSSKALYFIAGMEADDKGFFQPRKIQKMCGFSDDDFKILIAKGYFIAFESGVMVVTDWNKNNWLDSRRITETEYLEELNLLKLVNQKYELLQANEIVAKPLLSENSIEENSIEENSIYIERPQKKQKEKFTPPTLEEVVEYCKSRNNNVDPKLFYDYFTEGKWIDSQGNAVRNWKQKIITWENKKITKNDVPEWFNRKIETQQLNEDEEKEMEAILKDFKEG